MSDSTITRRAADRSGAGPDAGPAALPSAEPLLQRAVACMDAADPEAALRAAVEAGDVAHRLADRAAESRAATLQSRALFRIGLSRESFERAGQALDLARRGGSALAEAQALRQLSTLALDTGDEDENRRLLQDALRCARAAGSAEDEFWALNNLSNLQGIEAARCAERNDLPGAEWAVNELVVTVEQALAVALATGNWLHQAFAVANLADAYIVLRQPDRARQLIKEYADLARAHGFVRLLVYAGLDEARLLRDEGRPVEAIAVLGGDAHQRLLRGVDDLALATEEALVQLHKLSGDHEQALHHLEIVLQRQTTRLTLRAERQSRVLLARLDVEQARREAEQHASRALALERERDLLHRSARLDALTGVGNRRAADEALAARMAAIGDGSDRLFVAFVDVDHFKQVNDRFGHGTGDQVLLAMGTLMRGILRTRDEIFRFGGEEFVLLMSDTHASAGFDVCERLRQQIERHDWGALAPQLRVTASFGLACWQGEAGADELLARADAAMYRAKGEGRNRVVLG